MGLDAVQRPPAANGFVTATLPTDKLGSDLEARLKIESERSFVIKNDFDNVVIR